MDKSKKIQEKIKFVGRLKVALAIRGHSKKSYGELKELFKVSRTLVHAWLNEKAIGMPSIYTLPNICKTLKISYEWLLNGTGVMDGFEMQEPDEVALIEKYRGLTKQGKRKVIRTAFIDCQDNELTPMSKDERIVAKQTTLALVNKKS